jgi:hypothetical protein
MDHNEIKDSVDMVAPKIEQSEFIFHRVMAGETLATIARWYTGSESMWHEIAEDNPKLSPSSLRQGDIVMVSVSLATVHKEQPPYSTREPRAEESDSSKPSKATKKTNAAPAPAEGFGPR